jgi:hypothetical protein
VRLRNTLTQPDQQSGGQKSCYLEPHFTAAETNIGKRCAVTLDLSTE